MTSPTPPPPTQPPPRSSFGTRFLIGCAIGCGALAILALGGAGVGFFWFFSSGQQQATQSIVGSESSAAFYLSDLGGDPGLTALLDHLIIESQRQDLEDLPESMRWMRQFQEMQNPGGGQSLGVRFLVPREATLAVEGIEGEETKIVLAVNFRGFVRPVRWMIEAAMAPVDPEAGRLQYKGHEVLETMGGTALCFLGGTFLLAEDVELLKLAIGRLEEGQSIPEHLTVDEATLPGEWDLTGVLSSAESVEVILAMLNLPDGEGASPGDGLAGAQPRNDTASGATPDDLTQLLAGVNRVLFGYDLRSADRLVGTWLLECRDGDAAEELGQNLTPRLQEWSQRISEDHPVVLALNPVIEENRLRVDLDLTGLKEVVRELITSVK